MATQRTSALGARPASAVSSLTDFAARQPHYGINLAFALSQKAQSAIKNAAIFIACCPTTSRVCNPLLRPDTTKTTARTSDAGGGVHDNMVRISA
jgi:hypothetical protein